MSEYWVAERLQAAGWETYQALDVDGIDILAKKNGIEVTVQVKRARRIAGNRYQVGGLHDSAEHIRRAIWLVAVLPDLRMFLLPKTAIRGGRAVFNTEKTPTFNPDFIKLFTDTEVYTGTHESKRAAYLPIAPEGHQNTAAYFWDDNKTEVYLKQLCLIIARIYRDSGEEAFREILVVKIVKNVIHELIHAADPHFKDEKEINRIALSMMLPGEKLPLWL